jgi:hypothetical protein
MSGTERKSSTTKAFRGGRPRIGAEPLTVADRSRRYRAKRKAQAELPSDDGAQNAQDALTALISSRRIVNRFDQMLAVRTINALAEGKIVEVIKLLDALPQPYRAEAVAATAVSATDAKERLLELVLNACAADRFEAEQVEQTEITALRAEVAELRRRLGEQPNVDCSLHLPPEGEPKTITPSTGDILPPSENSHLPQNARAPVGADDAKYKPGRNTIIEHEPVKPAPSPTPMPPPQNWDETENGRAWNEWRRNNPDGYGGGGIL